jgi:hypothetical protein
MLPRRHMRLVIRGATIPGKQRVLAIPWYIYRLWYRLTCGYNGGCSDVAVAPADVALARIFRKRFSSRCHPIGGPANTQLSLETIRIQPGGGICLLTNTLLGRGCADPTHWPYLSLRFETVLMTRVTDKGRRNKGAGADSPPVLRNIPVGQITVRAKTWNMHSFPKSGHFYSTRDSQTITAVVKFGSTKIDKENGPRPPSEERPIFLTPEFPETSRKFRKNAE